MFRLTSCVSSLTVGALCPLPRGEEDGCPLLFLASKFLSCSVPGCESPADRLDRILIKPRKKFPFGSALTLRDFASTLTGLAPRQNFSFARVSFLSQMPEERGKGWLEKPRMRRLNFLCVSVPFSGAGGEGQAAAGEAKEAKLVATNTRRLVFSRVILAPKPSANGAATAEAQ